MGREPPVQQVEVPNLVNASSIEEARRIAGGDFRVVVGERRESEEEVGTILAQDPEPGTRVGPGSRITVDVVGTRVAQLPDVQGQSEGEARSRLERAGFRVEVERRESQASEEGFVISQNPTGGGNATAAVDPRPATVTLTVGTGPSTAPVPNLTGNTPEEAQAALQGAGLRLGEQGQEPSDTVAEGRIVSQSPAADVEVRKGTAVNVTVSTGPQLFPVPDVTGESLEDAQAELQDEGFVLGGVTEQSSDEVDEGEVISQDPAADAQVEAGTAVSVMVSTGPEVIVVPDVVGQDWILAAQTLQAEGLRVYQRAETAPSSEPKNTVLATDPSAGTEVEPGTAVRLTVSSGPPEQPGGGSDAGSSGIGGGGGDGVSDGSGGGDSSGGGGSGGSAGGSGGTGSSGNGGGGNSVGNSPGGDNGGDGGGATSGSGDGGNSLAEDIIDGISEGD
jgi:serine/threonine-protein kinase